MKEYYKAYDERYRRVHERDLVWFHDTPTPIVGEVLSRFGIPKSDPILELGCGEGRDAFPLLKEGYRLLATDVSPEAISFCRKQMPEYKDRFQVLDCVKDGLSQRFSMIYAIALLHMLVDDGDRQALLRSPARSDCFCC